MKFSVILPTRDRREWLTHAVQSVQNQTYRDWELVILDNSDVPYYQSSPWADDRILYRWRLTNGVADAYNRALGMATGDVIVPLGDDDVLPPDCLATSAAMLGEHEWLCGKTWIVNTDNELLAERGGTLESLAITKAGTYWLGGAVHWRKSLTDRLGSFQKRFDGAADFDLYLRFLNDSEPAVVDHVMYVYRDWPGTDSRVRAQNQREISDMIAEGARRG